MSSVNLITSLSFVSDRVGKFALGEKEFQTYQTNEAVVEQFIYDTYGNGKDNNVFLLCSHEVKTELISDSDKSLKIYNEEAKNMTHLEFFKDRIYKFCREENYILKKDFFKEIDIDNIFDIVEILKNSDSEIYIDLTGGLRIKAMQFLTFMKMLEYIGGNITKIIYLRMSNDVVTVENSIDVYLNYTLVAAAEEFTKFGSVMTLKEFCDKSDRKSENLNNIIKNMNQFSEALKLCMVHRFSEILTNLNESIKNYSAEDLSLKLLFERIRKDYESIMENTSDIPTIIKWCVERGFIQQALTMYVEKVPQYIVKNKIIFLRDEDKKEIEKRFEKSGEKENGRDMEYHFLTNYIYVENTDKYWKNICHLIKDGKFSDVREYSVTDDTRNFIDAMYNLSKSRNYFNLNENTKSYVRKAYKAKNNTETNIKEKDIENSFNTPTFTYKKILNILCSLKAKEIIGVMDKISKNNAEDIFKKRTYNFLYNKKLEKNIIKVLQDYYDIKEYRNNANHAGLFGIDKDLPVLEISNKIEKKIYECINLLKEVKEEIGAEKYEKN